VRSRGLPALPRTCDSLTCSRQDTPITVGSHFGSRRTALQPDRLPSGTGRSARTYEDVFAETGCEGLSAALAMQEVKDHLQDRNMLLNCDNVELSGFEPLTYCMALQAPSVARQGSASPGMSAACNDYGWMWPDVARRLPTLAPNLALSKPLSNANVPARPGQQDGPGNSCPGPRHRSPG
jgi:hypothetical protein